MNRQSRMINGGSWINRGPISFKEAAIEESRLVPLRDGGKTVVQVRDEAEPEIVHTLSVTRRDTYHVKGLRGGE